MSTPSQPDSEPDDLLRYAPKWARDPATVERRRELRLREADGLAQASAEGSIRRGHVPIVCLTLPNSGLAALTRRGHGVKKDIEAAPKHAGN